MNPDISVITLGVDDLKRSLTFYQDGLGWETDGIIGEEFDNGAVVFFKLPSGLRLALWPRKSIAAEMGVEVAGAANEVLLSHNVKSRKAVDDVMAEAKQAGAEILKPAKDLVWGGYGGFFTDPDGHIWEITWNPARN
ncbi:VOC family protein [Idiomarina aminovorans]|uniref:VOC family protein n=1 Tax=Idiomarina aminovorans TaxID=2914829 RepID=UPI002002EFB2|nr:VOC family protein [Idiomarina sp. ATCH4]MCK7459997.1 VOC family protein [Idiomarina sp. ATCH4]